MRKNMEGVAVGLAHMVKNANFVTLVHKERKMNYALTSMVK